MKENWGDKNMAKLLKNISDLPNLRRVQCCGNCRHGTPDYDDTVECNLLTKKNPQGDSNELFITDVCDRWKSNGIDL